jgi:hypothetical protein
MVKIRLMPTLDEWRTKDRYRVGLTKTTSEQQEIFDFLNCPKLSTDRY